MIDSDLECLKVFCICKERKTAVVFSALIPAFLLPDVNKGPELHHDPVLMTY